LKFSPKKRLAGNTPKPAPTTAAKPTPTTAAKPTPTTAAKPTPNVQKAPQGTQASTDQIRKLVQIMSSTAHKTITPSINFEKNLIKYPLLTQIGEDEYNMTFLDNLASKSNQVLEKFVFERLLVCPEHNKEFSATVRIYCPNCTSMDVEKLQLIEHKVCGFIATMKEYGVESSDDVQVCPNCKRQIRDPGKEIRLPGKWNICNSCEKKFDDAIIKLHCRRHNHDIDLESVDTIPIPGFKINKNVNENIEKITLFPPIKKMLTASGFMVEEFALVKGKSGMEHEISLYAYNNSNQTIVLFIKLSKSQIDDTEINKTLVEVIDIDPTQTIFIGIPSVSERAKAMAATHGIDIVTGKNPNEIVSLVEQILAKGIPVQSNPQSESIGD